MITIYTNTQEHVVKPTIFPDGTSQVWKLPDNLLIADRYLVVWHFESERELMDLGSVVLLLKQYKGDVSLGMPYLPYARQDKKISNDATFNLHVFARFINALELSSVVLIDPHSEQALKLINNSTVHSISDAIDYVVDDFNPHFVVFPDEGAENRYKNSFGSPVILCQKARNQATGELLGHVVHYPQYTRIKTGDKLLIVDDICDGGATFISVAKTIKEDFPNITIGLYVTHGIFSKGRQHLLDNGVDKIYTTNSILKNEDGYAV